MAIVARRAGPEKMQKCTKFMYDWWFWRARAVQSGSGGGKHETCKSVVHVRGPTHCARLRAVGVRGARGTSGNRKRRPTAHPACAEDAPEVTKIPDAHPVFGDSPWAIGERNKRELMAFSTEKPWDPYQAPISQKLSVVPYY